MSVINVTKLNESVIKSSIEAVDINPSKIYDEAEMTQIEQMLEQYPERVDNFLTDYNDVVCANPAF